MPIANIIDRRKRPYRWKEVNVIIEAAWHDNSVKDADAAHYDVKNDGPNYEELINVPLNGAIRYAQNFENPVTLYLYDKGDGVRIVRRMKGVLDNVPSDRQKRVMRKIKNLIAARERSQNVRTKRVPRLQSGS